MQTLDFISAWFHPRDPRELWRPNQGNDVYFWPDRHLAKGSKLYLNIAELKQTIDFPIHLLQ